MIGSLGSTNVFAAYVGITALSLFRKGWFVFVPIVLITLVLSKSNMGQFTFIAGVLYFIYKKFFKFNSYLPYSAVFILFTAFYLFGMGGLDSKRFEIWSHVFALVDMPHFLIGKGAGWFPDLKMAFHGKVALPEHHELITIFNIFVIVCL